MTKAGLPMQAMIDNLVLYVGLVVLAMVVLGALIGALSSLLPLANISRFSLTLESAYATMEA